MVELILILIWVHFFADFILQSDYIAINKSKSVVVLAIHCMLYAVCFIPFGLDFALATGLAHFLVDFFTSRLSAKLYQMDERHSVFVTIGFDQAIHLSALIAAAVLFQ